MVLLDTQVLLWLSAEPERLGSNSHRRIEAGRRSGENWISAISFWETAMLISKRRHHLILPVAEWREHLMAGGLEEIPVDGLIAVQAGELEWEHGDPADRIIVTTAMRRDLTLITADRRILAWPGPLKTMDARL